MIPLPPIFSRSRSLARLALRRLLLYVVTRRVASDFLKNAADRVREAHMKTLRLLADGRKLSALDYQAHRCATNRLCTSSLEGRRSLGRDDSIQLTSTGMGNPIASAANPPTTTTVTRDPVTSNPVNSNPALTRTKREDESRRAMGVPERRSSASRAARGMAIKRGTST